MTSPPTPLLLGRPGPWPFAGYFRGQLVHPEGLRVAWAGRVSDGADLTVAWRATLAMQQALSRKGPIDADRRRALSILWARLDGVHREGLGPAQGADLSLLLLAEDPDGIAVSAVGLRQLLGPREGALSPWVRGAHPLLGAPGIPVARPGALTSEEAPAVLVGIGDEVDAPRSVGEGLLMCGVWP
ncbi:MAG: hypothetical protein JXX28_14430 [Deltaproteobacteria bacterium]|nr:hypothetical protein [Deltaproteobacteria bacterium]